jgi:phosphoribosylformimino-5-aminoimidazole carboxamide ribotide isomerase
MAKFEVIPAVDIMGGKCVRLFKGKFDEMTVYDESPVDAALRWESMGATRIHVVDLDGAKTGVFTNLPIIKRIASSVKVPIQVGGGIRKKEIAEELLNAGVDRIMLGTAVIESPALVKKLFKKFAERIAVSIDAMGGKTAIKGWQLKSDKTPIELAREAMAMGIKRFVYTDISRDGTLTGPNFKGIKLFAEEIKANVIASGGVSSLKDIIALKKMSSIGVEGCVIGKALYCGKIDAKKALSYNSI